MSGRKKPKKKSIVTKELSIEQKEKLYFKDSVIIGIFMTIFIIYFMAAFVAYKDMNGKLALSDVMTGALNKIAGGNFWYMLRTKYILGLPAGTALIVDLFYLCWYYNQKMRIHNDVKTAKGRTQWADINDIVARYATWEAKDYKHCIKNFPLSQNVYMSLDTRLHYHNLNSLVLGASGTGKSRYVLKPNILQMNCSYIVTDPNGLVY